ncbi:MAG: UDP-N-acetylmuramoyl-tripeptide--D-alanyl-D-alanine ligase [bacterium]|nr:MAG: UDP-N-acetylmuramoyl-tripeptide--D-alanyl-D-alanine ligase [bacterium]
MERTEITHFLQKSQTVKQSVNLPGQTVFPGISIDTRTLLKGEVYIAIRGERFDGHDFIPEAIKKGAVGIVYSDTAVTQNLSPDVFGLQVSDTLQFLMEFAGWYRSHYDLSVFALTGSTGKTTTKEMLAGILNRGFITLKTKKNLNNFIGVSLTLLELEKSTEMAVIELGTNHPGEIAILTQIVRPTHAAITNIGSGHIGFFGSQEAIFQEKTSLFENMSEGGNIYLNMEDPFLSCYTNNILRIHTYGLSSSYNFWACYLGMDQRGHIRFTINDGPEIMLQIPGKHQLMNGLLAGTVALDLGISYAEVKAGLESVLAPDKRMEIFDMKGIKVINDAYNSNPESLKAAIDFVIDLPVQTGCRKVLVLGDMLELGDQSEAAHLQIGEYLEDKPVDVVFCYGPYASLIVDILNSKKESSTMKEAFDSHKLLAEALGDVLHKGDILLLKGSRGMTLEKILEYLDGSD